MESSFAHKKVIKRFEKWTYAQSYPHYPQKNLERTEGNSGKIRINVLCKMLKKIFLIKKIDKSSVE